MAIDKIPPLSHDLIELLDADYPDRCPHIEDTDREIWFNAGQRSVINRLLALRKQEDANIME